MTSYLTENSRKHEIYAKPERVRFYESFGEIFIDYHDKSEYTDYKKELELSEAIVKDRALGAMCIAGIKGGN